MLVTPTIVFTQNKMTQITKILSFNKYPAWVGWLDYRWRELSHRMIWLIRKKILGWKYFVSYQTFSLTELPTFNIFNKSQIKSFPTDHNTVLSNHHQFLSSDCAIGSRKFWLTEFERNEFRIWDLFDNAVILIVTLIRMQAVTIVLFYLTF